MVLDSMRTVEQYGGVLIEIGEGLATCTARAWTISSQSWRIEGTDRQCDVLSEPYKKYMERRKSGAVQCDCTCVTAPPFFSKAGPLAGRSVTSTPFFSKTVPLAGRSSDATGKSRNTDKPVFIIWDGLSLNEEERESAMSWMTTSKSWVLWKQQDSSSSTKNSENAVEEKHRTKVGREEVLAQKLVALW